MDLDRRVLLTIARRLEDRNLENQTVSPPRLLWLGGLT